MQNHEEGGLVMRWKKEMILSNLVFFILAVAIIFTGCGGDKTSISPPGGGGTQTFTVGGTVSGLNGTIILQNNGGDDLTITTDGSFTFATALADGSSYNVTIKTHPSGQCGFIANGGGTISGGAVTDVSVDCYNSGSLDPTFDSDGMRVYNGGNADRGNSIIIDDDGKILVTGYSGGGLARDMLIWRYNTDGSADTTFDTDGIVVYDYTGGTNPNPDSGSSITTDADGKILVSGWDYFTVQGLNSLLTWRYNTDGSLDPDFDPDFDPGIDPYPYPQFFVNASTWYDRSITTDSSNKILVVGSTTIVPQDMVILRYNTDGTEDDTFGSWGLVKYDGGSSDNGHSTTIDANGKILVTGYSQGANLYDMVIWRYNTDGSPDTDFDTDGMLVYDGGIDDDEEGYCITTDANGKILVTGYSYNVDSNTDMVIWRYNADGSLDDTFDTDGMAVYDSGVYEEGYSITTDAKGRILVTGYIYDGSDYDMAIWRYDADGNPDTNFDTDGVAIYDSGGYNDQGLSITIDADGKILVTGYSNNGSNDDMVIWRYIQ
jgi:uncharacterized delta-60 repeat protein